MMDIKSIKGFKDGVISTGINGADKTYARIWFDGDGDVVIAEPYSQYESGKRHYYNRETEFKVEQVF